MQTALNRAPSPLHSSLMAEESPRRGPRGQPVPVQWATDLEGWSLSVRQRETYENSSDARTNYPDGGATGGADRPFEREFSSGTIPVRQPGPRPGPEQS